MSGANRSVLVMFLALAGWGGDGTEQSAASATSNLCPNVTGTEAILWDLYNGVIRTDVSVLPPPVPVPGGSYTHPAFPLLGFIYPGGWTPTTTNTGGFQEIGVNLIRQDQQAIWREQPQVVCINEGSGDAGGGIIVSFSRIMIRVGNHTAVIAASVTPLPRLPTSSIRTKVVASPTAEFQPARSTCFWRSTGRC
ncbi:MAG: hypothetical protein OEN21_13850 [Myxococcales bacterium]|nr:hypothetical protein [Myxococcales bacterium]